MGAPYFEVNGSVQPQYAMTSYKTNAKQFLCSILPR